MSVNGQLVRGTCAVALFSRRAVRSFGKWPRVRTALRTATSGWQSLAKDLSYVPCEEVQGDNLGGLL